MKKKQKNQLLLGRVLSSLLFHLWVFSGPCLFYSLFSHHFSGKHNRVARNADWSPIHRNAGTAASAGGGLARRASLDAAAHSWTARCASRYQKTYARHGFHGINAETHFQQISSFLYPDIHALKHLTNSFRKYLRPEFSSLHTVMHDYGERWKKDKIYSEIQMKEKKTLKLHPKSKRKRRKRRKTASEWWYLTIIRQNVVLGAPN